MTSLLFEIIFKYSGEKCLESFKDSLQHYCKGLGGPGYKRKSTLNFKKVTVEEFSILNIT
jgi:hypothetical protein